MIDEYLQLISRDNDLVNNFNDLLLGFDRTYRVPLPDFKVRPELLRAITKSCRKNECMEVAYRS